MVLYGWQRKLAILPLSLSVAGWVVFSIGFIWELIDWPQEEEENGYTRTTPLLFSRYLLLVGGPIVYVLGVVQAVLPGTCSAVLGIPTAFLSTLYVVTAGAETYSGAVDVKRVILGLEKVQTKSLLITVGVLIITVTWCLVLMLSVCYKSKSRRNPYALLDPPVRPVRRKYPFTPGVARGLSVPFIVLSLAGWCVLTMGICKSDPADFLGSFEPSFGMYGAIVVGPLLFLAALLHAGCSGGASTVMGVFSSVLSTLYAVFVGFIVYTFGEVFYVTCQLSPEKPDCSFLHSSLNINWIYTFAGGVGSLFFWTVVLALWPFYRYHSQEGQDSIVINATNGYGTMRLEESFSNADSNNAQNSSLFRERGER